MIFLPGCCHQEGLDLFTWKYLLCMPSLGSALDRLGPVDTRSREPLVLSIVGVVKNDHGDVADSIGTGREPRGVHSKPVGSAIFFRTFVHGELSHQSYGTSCSRVVG